MNGAPGLFCWLNEEEDPGAPLKPVKPDEKFSGWVVAIGFAKEEKEELNNGVFVMAVGALILLLLAEEKEENMLLEPPVAAALPKLNILLPVAAVGLIDAPKDMDPGCCCCC